MPRKQAREVGGEGGIVCLQNTEIYPPPPSPGVNTTRGYRGKKEKPDSLLFQPLSYSNVELAGHHIRTYSMYYSSQCRGVVIILQMYVEYCSCAKMHSYSSEYIYV
jgi:hypothetical protein